MRLENKNIKSGKKTLLLIENSDACAFLIQEALGNSINIITVQNGIMALNMIKNKKIDIVLLDIILPDVNGFTLCEEIKKITPSTPVIATTAYNRFLDGNKNQIFDEYILKPINIKELIETINTYLNKYNTTLTKTCI